MKRVLFYIVSFCTFVTNVMGQEEFVEPSRFLTRIPFKQLTGGVILLKAQLAHYTDSLQFILDTGSGGISLDSTTTDYLGVKPVASERTIRGIGGIKKVGFVYNQKLHVPGLSIDSLDFHVNNYEVLTSVYGERIDGIIGFSVLKRYILKINYDSLTIEFWTKGAIKYPKGGFMLRPTISSIPVNMVRVKDENTYTTRFLFDIGAGLNLMLSSDFLTDSALLKKKRKLYLKSAQGVGGKVDMHITVIKEVRIGPYRFKRVPVHVFNDEYNLTSYPYLGGILGNDLLRRFNLILNYEARIFYLTPNSHYSDPFDYTYTGLELYFVDGQVVVGDVSKGSPAANAGIQEGDVVVAINRNFAQNIKGFKNALQNVIGKVKFVVLRNGNLLEFEFKVANIMK